MILQIIALFFVLLLLFAAIVPRRLRRRFIRRRTAPEGLFPVAARPLLSFREQEMHRRLSDAFPGHHVFTQVALSQLVEVKRGVEARQGIRNSFNQLVADFVICDPRYALITVVEVDDASHRRRDRQVSDARKSKVLESAGIPLLRIPAGARPTIEELREMLVIEEHLEQPMRLQKRVAALRL